MAEYTLTEAEVRECFQASAEGLDFKREYYERGEAFDRWLAAHDAELRAEVERLRDALTNTRAAMGARIEDRDRMLRDIMRERDEAWQQVADLRAFASWLVSLDDDNPDSPGRQERRTVTLSQIIDRARVALAGPGEHPGDRPAPVVPDSADVRERALDAAYRALNARGRRSRLDEARWPEVPLVVDAVLAVAGQGVTAETEVGRVNRLLGVSLWDAPSFRADVRIDFHEDGSIYGATLLNPSVVREDRPVDDGRPAADTIEKEAPDVR